MSDDVKVGASDTVSAQDIIDCVSIVPARQSCIAMLTEVKLLVYS